VERSGLDDGAVNELIIKRTCGGPKRFRPKTREELQRDNAGLEKQVRCCMRGSEGTRRSNRGAQRVTHRSHAVDRGARYPTRHEGSPF